MDLARGNMICQLWGDLYMFEDGDNEFLARVNAWIAPRSHLLANPVRILVDPWKGEPYGYAYSEDGHGIAFVYNPTFDMREVSFPLANRSVEATLRPFDVRVLEVADGLLTEFIPDPDAVRNRAYLEVSADIREVSRTEIRCENPDQAYAWKRVVNGRAGYADLKDKWGPKETEAAEKRDCKVVRRQLSGTIALPETRGPADLILVFQAE